MIARVWFGRRKAEDYDPYLAYLEESEFHVSNPISVYARSKLGGEAFVRSVLPESFVVRTGWCSGAWPTS